MSYTCTCRFCKKTRCYEDMIKYSTRAYACIECYIKHKTIADAERLPLFEANKLREQGWKF